MRLLLWPLLIGNLAWSSPDRSMDSSPSKHHVSPRPSGDTRMGADAAASGTDITDQDIQEQEVKKRGSQLDNETELDSSPKVKENLPPQK